jgi:hypothetical protein
VEADDMNTDRSPRPPAPVTRRRFLLGAASLAGGAAVVVVTERSATSGGTPPPIALGTQPPNLPARQHAWTETLARDHDGNAIAPRFDCLLFFDLVRAPDIASQHVLEAALRTLERRYRWGPDGLLFTVGWGPGYFTRGLRRRSPIPRARALSEFELPTIDEYDVCIHLACDSDVRLAAVENALVRGMRLGGADGPVAVSSTLRWRETRTGFVGAGLPSSHQRIGGIPPGDPVPAGSPLFMGFKSNLRKNQASEDAVTIEEPPLSGATTMQVSYMRLRLESWYGDLSERDRVARMYAPQVTPAQVSRFTTDAKSDPALLGEAIRRYGVVGHSQTSARARRHGKPLILRRDFNTVDGGQAGLHFVSLQRSIADFVTTRNAMNATSAQLQNPAITDTVNNGINEFMLVLRRANYLIPSRAERSFPMLNEGRLE